MKKDPGTGEREDFSLNNKVIGFARGLPFRPRTKTV